MDVQSDVVQPDVQPDVPMDTGPNLVPVNNCDPATATDLTAAASPSITFPGMGTSPAYTPPCIKISAGQSVVFTPDSGDSFDNHPLIGGTVMGSTATPDSSSPIGMNLTGMTGYTVMFATPGSYGFYSSTDFMMGAEGAVYVVP
jgi:plastocyanin